ncbi:MAG TPA: hypothetical protein VK032_00785 [Burkholderiaceae bacterium]|nr:hypothetical protein [Burkholderiaceae bacterium]
MSRRRARKRTPFVVEPLNWVAPDLKKKEVSERKETDASDNESEGKS